MTRDDQLQQLCELYAEKRDDELQDMYSQREDLTEVAEQALMQVMRSPNLQVLPGRTEEQPAQGAPADFSAPLTADEVEIWTSTDAFEAGEALRLLTEAGFSPRAVNWNELDPPDYRRPSINLGIIVRRSAARAAQKVLADRMRLFPSPSEVEDPFAELTGMMQVGRFTREDALVVAATLGAAAISFAWKDDRDDPEATTDEVSIEVKGETLETAQKLVEERFGA